MEKFSYIEQIKDIAKNNHTPYFVILEKTLRDNYGFLKQCFAGLRKLKVYYSIKTNFESRLLLTLKDMGLDAEVCGQLDMFLAEKAGFKKENIIFDACYKTQEDITKALNWGIHLFNVESEKEIDTIDRIARGLNKKAGIGLRVDSAFLSLNPSNLIMKPLQKSFGFSAERVLDIAVAAGRRGSIEICGLMAHNNYPHKSSRDYAKMLKMLFVLAVRLKKHGINIRELNLGGGFPGIQLKEDVSAIAKSITEEYNSLSRKHNLSPTLVIEPGRALVENAAMLIGRIMMVEDGRAHCDISINDLGYKFTFKEKNFFVLNLSPNGRRHAKVDICGPTLNPYDKLYFKRRLQSLEAGDILVILNAGAYTISCSTQFTRPRAAVYFINSDGEKSLIRKAETPADVLNTQLWSKDEDRH